MILTFIAVITVTFSPSRPTVGDLITVEFKAPVTLDRSEQYEIVRQDGPRVVIRTFRPRPIVLSGVVGKARFNNLRLPVTSVLKPDDNMQPAPLAPPRRVPYDRGPFIAIGAAAVAAIAAWAAVWFLATRRAAPIEMHRTPEERFRETVVSLRAKSPRGRWAALADATRLYLAQTRADLGSELTTRELVPRLNENDRVVQEILEQGDLEKFSPSGAAERDFDDVARRALLIAEAPRSDEGAAA